MGNEKKLYYGTIITIIINMMNSWGWISIPWSVLMIPSVILALVWLYVVVVATILIIKYPDRYR